MKSFLLACLSMLGAVCLAQEAQFIEPFTFDVEGPTARSMGTAGSFGAVGADFSSATHNPAGIAFFRKKELGLSLAQHNQRNTVDFLGNSTESSQGIFQLNSVGFVYSDIQNEWVADSLEVVKNGLVSWAVTIGMNQKSELNEVINYNGFNNNSSLISSYVASANQFGTGGLSALDEFEKQAISTGLMDFTEQNGRYQYSSVLTNGNVEQNGNTVRRGAKRDFYLGGGLNLSNQLYLGAALGVPYYSFTNNVHYTETDTQNELANFESLKFDDEREYTGVGGYLGLGAIYRVSDFFRAGVNFRTPTVVVVNEKSSIATMANYESSNDQSASENYESKYQLTLPWKAGLQLVASHPMYGLISLEGDYVDYSSSRLTYDDEMGDYSLLDEDFKQSIKDTYKGTFNLRGGVEARLLRDLRLRAGYAYYNSPYKNEADEFGVDYSKKVLGVGLGYRFVPQNINIDLGYNHIKTGEWDSAYLLYNQPNEIVKDQASSQIRLAISKRFNN